MKILFSALFAVGLFVGVLACMRLGWRFGRKRLTDEGESGLAGLGAVEGSVYGLVGLLIAFTFTGAATRFGERRALITQQVNAIGTAWLRLDLTSGAPRDELRNLFRRYVDMQLALSHNAGNPRAMDEMLERFWALQSEIWSKATEATRLDPASPPAVLLLPPINQMFDIAETRRLLTRQHPPIAIYIMLGVLVLASALMAGYGMARAKSQSQLHVLGFATIMALSVYLILDLEFPRLGFVRVDAFDCALVELRASMN